MQASVRRSLIHLTSAERKSLRLWADGDAIDILPGCVGCPPTAQDEIDIGQLRRMVLTLPDARLSSLSAWLFVRLRMDYEERRPKP